MKSLYALLFAALMLQLSPTILHAAPPVAAKTEISASVKAGMKDEVDKLRAQHKDQLAKLRVQQKDQRDKLRADQKQQMAKLKADHRAKLHKSHGDSSTADNGAPPAKSGKTAGSPTP